MDHSHLPLAAQSDEELMRRAAGNDREALGQLVMRYQPALLRVAHSRLGRSDWAEEVVQETFLAVCRWRHTFKAGFRVRTWLWTILLRACGRHAQLRSRHDRRRATASEDEPPVWECVAAPSVAPPDARLLHRERTGQLERLLSQLRPEVADALRLRFFGGLKFHEIANTMQCSLPTAKNRVRAGLLELSHSMTRELRED